MSSSSELPQHLARYVSDQDYLSYTPRDQAVWRHVLRRLRSHLAEIAHPAYLRGLDETGIDIERIPHLSQMNDKLRRLGWRCVGVRGFIPPAVFTELQSLSVLAIAADIRSHKTIGYTPAPDIIHESAGHSPILVDDAYSTYVKRCGEVGFKAIASAEDRALFEAIRNLSVVKEDPSATPDDVNHAQARLDAAGASVRYVSESTKASRLYWWTAEYGLVGSLERPRLYGAGLLSSIAEAQQCLEPQVKKVPLSPACAEQSYDITKMQPQLYVAEDFAHLNDVLDAFRKTLSCTRGGDVGLDEALRSCTVNHLVIETATKETFELTGEVVRLHRLGLETGPALTTSAIELSGPTMVSQGCISSRGPQRMAAVVLVGEERLPTRGRFSVRFASGLVAQGFAVGHHEVIDFSVTHQGQKLHLPTWATVLVAAKIPSVAGAAADPAAWDKAFGQLDSFTSGDAEAKARANRTRELSSQLASMYTEVRTMREQQTLDRARLLEISKLAPSESLLQSEVSELLN
jgi:phenylalanine-4-hydroxylase